MSMPTLRRTSMTTAAFVDTAYFVALLDPRDSLHDLALELAADLAKRSTCLITSDAVLIEFGNYFARSPLRTHALDWILSVREAAGWETCALARPLLTR